MRGIAVRSTGRKIEVEVVDNITLDRLKGDLVNCVVALTEEGALDLVRCWLARNQGGSDESGR